MSGRHRRPRKGFDVVQPSPHSAEDLEYLEDFCRDLQVDEVSFEVWTHAHNSLDLSIPLTIDRSDIRAGGKEIGIQWTRSIQERPGGPTKREKTSKAIVVPAEAKDGDIVVLKGMGDQVGEDCGDLKIIIRVK